MQPNQIQIQGAQPTGARIQLQTQPIPQPQHRLQVSQPPPTLQIINASPGHLAPGHIITTAGTPRVSAAPGHVLLPRNNLPRLVIRPSPGNSNPGGQQITTRAIAPAIQPRPNIFPAGVTQHGVTIGAQGQSQTVMVPVSISPHIRAPVTPASIRMIPAPLPPTAAAASAGPPPPPSEQQLNSAPARHQLPVSVSAGGCPVMPSGRVQGATSHLKHGDLLDKRKIQDLVNEVDPNQQLDEGVQELLLQIADDFIEKTITTSCQIAKHRNSNSLEVSDVQLFLERNFNMWVPGFSHSDDVSAGSASSSSGVNKLLSESGATPPKKSMGNEAHKQRMALLRKSLKK